MCVRFRFEPKKENRKRKHDEKRKTQKKEKTNRIIVNTENAYMIENKMKTFAT